MLLRSRPVSVRMALPLSLMGDLRRCHAWEKKACRSKFWSNSSFISTCMSRRMFLMIFCIFSGILFGICLEVGNYFVSLQQRCNVGGISHVGIARCAGFGMTICIFFCLYKPHIVDKLAICQLTFELDSSSLILHCINTKKESMVSPRFYSVVWYSTSIGKPVFKFGRSF